MSEPVRMDAARSQTEKELISRAKELLADGTAVRVLGWRAGDMPYNPEAAYFETPESLDEFVYNGFCGAN
ncbi:MAG: hypothetical protein LUI07_09300, partial [Lachnospiraceae bacterium]|nr:hypothetical protein [Lachnospiraceae bacterium]